MNKSPFERAKQELISYWRKSRMITDERVLYSFCKVKREHFVLEQYISEAYRDYPLPILSDQTISQPTTVLIMTQALDLQETDKILEVGTGSGYQAAIISHIVKQGKVYSIEIVPELFLFAKENLAAEGVTNVEVICTDGSNGYEKEAPYDKIVVTAAAPSIPKPLFEQLKDGGILIVPVGTYSQGQDLLRIRKTKETCKVEHLGGFVFVPLKGEYGQ